MTDDIRQLVTAAVDGELPPAQDAAFRRLLAESADARALYQQLTAQSTRLKWLPRASAPPSLLGDVMARIAPVEPKRIPAAVPSRRVERFSFAVAASTLLAVAVGSIWYVTRPDVQPQPDGFVQHTEQPRPAPEPDGKPASQQHQPDKRTEVAVAPKVVEPKPSDPVVPPRPETIPSPRVSEPDYIAAALLNSPPPLERVEVRLPFLATVAELDRMDIQARFADELSRDAAYRLDLFARDTHRGAEAFLAAARQAGLTVAVDAVAQDRMKKKLPVAWAVYTEALTAEDISRLAAALATEDRNAFKGTFGFAHVLAAKDAERRELRELLGTDPNLHKRPKAATVPQPGKAIGAGTVDQVTAAINKSKGGEKPAVLLTYLPTAGRADPRMSKEVREFLARRDDRKPGVVPLFVVIRPPGS